MAKCCKSKEYIVMLPYMAQGHLIPFLALARRLRQRTGFSITVANTPLNIQSLRSTLNSDVDVGIRLVELPFSSADHGLPPNAENSENLSLELIGKLFTASTALEAPFHRLVSDIAEQEGQPPVCIISDVYFGWASEVANSIGTVNVTFATGGAYGTLAYFSVWLNLPHRNAIDSDGYFGVPGFPDSCRFHISQLHHFIRNADGTDSWSKFMQSQVLLCFKSVGWLCNTVEEIEPLPLQWFKNFIKLPVWTVAPLFDPSGGSTSSQRAAKQPGLSTESCLEWLNSHNHVLYISFGSQNTISASQMMELAIGLEGSGRPFIWVIRPPIGFDPKGEFREEWLPNGFEERMKNRKQGLLVRSWGPQLEILSHNSTGAFLSHCGWNSVLESLSRGVPLIGWPLAAEQGYNCKMLAEQMGVCVELTRGVHSTIDGKEVERVIELVMDKKGIKGKDMKNKAVAMGELIIKGLTEVEGLDKGSSVKAIDDLVNTLQSLNLSPAPE